MITLREALEQQRLSEFVAERDDEIGDAEAFNLTLQAMAGKSKEAPEASSRSDGDD